MNEVLVASGILRKLLPKIYAGGPSGAYLRAIIAQAEGDESVAWNKFIADSAASAGGVCAINLRRPSRFDHLRSTERPTG